MCRRRKLMKIRTSEVTLGSFWGHFGDDVGSTLGSLWTLFGVTLDRNSTHFLLSDLFHFFAAGCRSAGARSAGVEEGRCKLAARDWQALLRSTSYYAIRYTGLSRRWARGRSVSASRAPLRMLYTGLGCRAGSVMVMQTAVGWQVALVTCTRTRPSSATSAVGWSNVSPAPLQARRVHGSPPACRRCRNTSTPATSVQKMEAV